MGGCYQQELLQEKLNDIINWNFQIFVFVLWHSKENIKVMSAKILNFYHSHVTMADMVGIWACEGLKMVHGFSRCVLLEEVLQNM